MANEVVIALASASKVFNNGVGSLNFPLVAAQATLNSGSTMWCDLPYGSLPMGAMVFLASVAGAAKTIEYTLATVAIIAETTAPTPPRVAVSMLGTAAVMASTGFVKVAVVM